MKKTIAMAALAVCLVPTATMAGERGGDAALGALSGAIVLGPVGAVAGAVIGYTAGPSISRSWGLHRSAPARHVRRSSARRADAPVPRAAPVSAPSAPAATAAPPLPRTASTTPPVQGLE